MLYPLLRRFDVSILASILPKIEPEPFESFKQKHYLDLIRELGSRIYWREQGGYALDDMLKTMLSSYVRTFEPDRYEAVNLITAETYKTWLQEEYRPHYLLEMLYHKLKLEKMREAKEARISQILSDNLLDYIEGRQETGPSQVNELDFLRNMLVQDEDLRPFITQKVFDIIDCILMANV